VFSDDDVAVEPGVFHGFEGRGFGGRDDRRTAARANEIAGTRRIGAKAPGQEARPRLGGASDDSGQVNPVGFGRRKPVFRDARRRHDPTDESRRPGLLAISPGAIRHADRPPILVDPLRVGRFVFPEPDLGNAFFVAVVNDGLLSKIKPFADGERDNPCPDGRKFDTGGGTQGGLKRVRPLLGRQSATR